MVRQLGPAARFRSAADGRSRLERLGEGAMQGASLARQQVVVHDLLDERVAERIALHAVAGLDDEEMAADRGAESVEQFVLGQAGDLGEQLVLDATAGDRGHAQDGRCCLRHCGDVSEQDLAERRREARAGAALAARGQQLLGEERVAVRAAVDIRHELGVGLRAEDRAEQRGDLGAAETGEVDPLDAAPAIQFGEPRQQRVATVELVAAERADEQDGHVPEGPDEVGDGLAGCAVGPVQVLDDQQHRRALGKPLEQAEERLEQPGLHPIRL